MNGEVFGLAVRAGKNLLGLLIAWKIRPTVLSRPARQLSRLRGSKTDLPKTVDENELTIWETDWGEMHVNITVVHKTLDITPLLRGLPDDLCQCPHWGMVLNGRKVVKFKDREEILNGGDAYYMPPGHTTVTDAGTEWLEISPKEELKKTNAAVFKNLGAIKP